MLLKARAQAACAAYIISISLNNNLSMCWHIAWCRYSFLARSIFFLLTLRYKYTQNGPLTYHCDYFQIAIFAAAQKKCTTNYPNIEFLYQSVNPGHCSHGLQHLILILIHTPICHQLRAGSCRVTTSIYVQERKIFWGDKTSCFMLLFEFNVTF